MAVHHYVRMEPAAGAQFDMLTDNAIRPNLAIRANLRPGMNESRGVNHTA